MKLLRTFTVFIWILLGACSHQRADHLHPATTLFPLSVGQYWVYQIERGDEQMTLENTIASSQTIGGIEWFLSIEFGEKFWIRNTTDGQVEAVNLYTQSEHAVIFENLDPKAVREELLFKYPARAGDSWVALENTLRYEGKRTVETPAGIFHCHAYSISQYGQTYSHSCIAEGVGVVYSDNTLPDGSTEVALLQSWGKR